MLDSGYCDETKEQSEIIVKITKKEYSMFSNHCLTSMTTPYEYFPYILKQKGFPVLGKYHLQLDTNNYKISQWVDNKTDDIYYRAVLKTPWEKQSKPILVKDTLRKVFVYFTLLCLIFTVLGISITAHVDTVCEGEDCKKLKTRATLKWEFPTKRLNGAPLSKDELDYFEVKIKMKDTGEEYLFDRFPVKEDGEYITERFYTTVQNQQVHISPGVQCFAIKVVDTGGLHSDYTPYHDGVCVEMMEPDGFELKIRIGMTEED